MTGVRSPAHTIVWLLAAGLLASACAGTETAAPPGRLDVPETVPLGELPQEPRAPRPPMPPSTPPPTVADTAPTTVPPGDRLAGPLAGEVFDNRVLVVGDEVLATTAPRFLGSMCAELTALGWDVEIAAEPGRFVDFATDVLDRRLRPDGGLDWDVVVLQLGNHFDGDFDAFTRTYEAAIEAIAPRPLVVLTVTELEDDHARINEYIRDRVRFHPGVVVVDWAAMSVDDPALLKFPDKPTPSADGEQRLVAIAAEILGTWNADAQGVCIPPVFTDDSAIVI